MKKNNMDNCIYFPMNFEKKLRAIIKNSKDVSPNIDLDSLIKEHNLKRDDKIIIATLTKDEDEEIISFHIFRIKNDEIELLATEYTLRVCLEETVYEALIKENYLIKPIEIFDL